MIFSRGGRSTVLGSFAVLITILLGVGSTAEASDTVSLRQLVQKPVAVDKLVEAGYLSRPVRELTRTLHEADVAPSDFNDVLLNLPYFAGSINNMKGSVNFVVQQHERGLDGHELVQSFRDELTGHNMAWRSTQNPLSPDYLDSSARNILSRVRESIRDRRGLEEGTPEPPSSGEQGGRPAPAPTPGPQGPGSPRGPGTPDRPY